MILLVLISLQIPKEPELGTYSMPKLPFMYDATGTEFVQPGD